MCELLPECKYYQAVSAVKLRVEYCKKNLYQIVYQKFVLKILKLWINNAYKVRESFEVLIFDAYLTC